MKNEVSIMILIQGITFSLHGQGSWTQKADFGGTERAGAVGFSIEEKGYVGTGSSGSKEFWEYDPTLDSWTQKADLEGQARQYAVGFSIGSYGYVGTGDGSGQLHDFWCYVPANNSWTQKANFAGGPRRWATGISIGDKGYIGLGSNSSGNCCKKDWWEYDPGTNTWTEKAKLPGLNRGSAVGFSIGNKGYVGTGGVENQYGRTNDFWQYDPATNTWTQISDYPGRGWSWGVAFSIGEYGYVGTGVDTNSIYTNDFWQYNPSNDSWIELANLPGEPRYSAVGFAISGKGYIGTGETEGLIAYLNDFWEFTPSCETPAGLTTTNIKATTAKVNWSVEPTAQSYSVRYRKTGTVSWTKTTATTNFKKLAGLAPNTQYDWSVKSICDAVNNISSDWSSTQNFTTKPLRLEAESEVETTLEVDPNPFHFQTTISFYIEQEEHTTLEAFDLTGRKVMLLDQMMQPGDHDFVITREQIGYGVFLVRLITGNETSIIKVIVQ